MTAAERRFKEHADAFFADLYTGDDDRGYSLRVRILAVLDMLKHPIRSYKWIMYSRRLDKRERKRQEGGV